MRTLVGVLLAKVYEEDDPLNMRLLTIERYSLNTATFDKYYKIVFGEEDGRQ